MYQSSAFGLSWTPTPLVVDGIMYLTQRPNDIVALDARTGRVFWIYSYPTPPDVKSCCGWNNRGVALLGERVFMATLDAHVVALDAATGAELWDVELADNRLQYSFTLAPLAIKGLVLVGTSGGDRGIRGFISALDAATGEEVWRFYTIPAPGEPGHETWEPCPPDPETYCDPEAWKHGGGSGLANGVVRPGAESDVLGGSATQVRTGTPPSGRATTCTPARWWRSTPTPASCAGTSSSRPAIPTTTTLFRSRCWLTSSAAGPR